MQRVNNRLTSFNRLWREKGERGDTIGKRYSGMIMAAIRAKDLARADRQLNRALAELRSIR
jgi:hypothetical protein